MARESAVRPTDQTARIVFVEQRRGSDPASRGGLQLEQFHLGRAG